MKAAALILLSVFCTIECRKIVPINKHANIDFINMESGGMRPAAPAVQPPKQPVPQAVPSQPAPAPVAPAPAKPQTPVPAAKPVPVPVPTPPKPAQPTPAQIKPVPVNPPPASNPITTPGPGSVKSLINFYDSRGNASPIRPYSYSQAVKQG
ncbi:uncharacterized protein LOC110378899 [Helicoverpa armigera]|uniref:uncharacterized protein LOC110378899 n=1 Tax=Helicoverpa armigera TaxID=29058 RepID=UPI003083E162